MLKIFFLIREGLELKVNVVHELVQGTQGIIKFSVGEFICI